MLRQVTEDLLQDKVLEPFLASNERLADETEWVLRLSTWIVPSINPLLVKFVIVCIYAMNSAKLCKRQAGRLILPGTASQCLWSEASILSAAESRHKLSTDSQNLGSLMMPSANPSIASHWRSTSGCMTSTQIDSGIKRAEVLGWTFRFI